ncbi:MAG: hypothetical protein OEU26_28265 [Candidatus Tectomicrobia bacterium]|nr:hypothetical protein [Candidatus Tectomicrobia bacterium]
MARTAFARFVTNGQPQESPWKELRGQIDLGSDCFVEEMEQRIGPDRYLHEIPVQQRRRPARKLSYDAARYRDRDRAMAAAYRSGTYSMREIGAYVSVSRMTVSRAVRQHEGA